MGLVTFKYRGARSDAMAPPRLLTAALPLLLALVPASGCLGAPEEPMAATRPGAVPTAEEDASMAAEVPADPMDEAEPARLAERALHLATDGTLADEPPEPGTMPMAGSYAACFGLASCQVLTFESEPLPTAIVIPPQTVTVRYRVEAVAPIAPGPFGFAAWFGSTVATPLFAIKEVGPMAPGVSLVEVPLEVTRPIVVPEGASLRLHGLAGNLHEGSGLLKLLVGGEHASAVTFSWRPLTLPASLAAAAAETFTGTLVAGSFPVGDPVPKEHREAYHAFTVDANATRVLVSLRQSGGPRPGDLDLDVLLGGDLLAGSHTSGHEEAVFLAGPALAGLHGKELTVRVSNFFSPNASYELIVTQQ